MTVKFLTAVRVLTYSLCVTTLTWVMLVTLFVPYALYQEDHLRSLAAEHNNVARSNRGLAWAIVEEHYKLRGQRKELAFRRTWEELMKKPELHAVPHIKRRLELPDTPNEELLATRVEDFRRFSEKQNKVLLEIKAKHWSWIHTSPSSVVLRTFGDSNELSIDVVE